MLDVVFVDGDGGGGPDVVEDGGEADGVELVEPGAVVVGPAGEGGGVDAADAEPTCSGAFSEAEAGGAAADDGGIVAVGGGGVVVWDVDGERLGLVDWGEI